MASPSVSAHWQQFPPSSFETSHPNIALRPSSVASANEAWCSPDNSNSIYAASFGSLDNSGFFEGSQLVGAPQHRRGLAHLGVRVRSTDARAWLAVRLGAEWWCRLAYARAHPRWWVRPAILLPNLEDVVPVTRRNHLWRKFLHVISYEYSLAGSCQRAMADTADCHQGWWNTRELPSFP